MGQGTYRIAYDEAITELSTIVEQFEELRLRKERVEKVVEALKPFVGLQTGISAEELEPAFAKSEPVQQASQAIIHSISEAGIETPTESIRAPIEIPTETVLVPVAATSEAVSYYGQSSSDPFQRRIDDALWGWQQRPEGLLSPI